MIKNKLKINDSKTEFIIFRSPQCKASISGVSVSVGDSSILPSPKVRDLGVILDECLTLDAHNDILVIFVDMHIFISETLVELGCCCHLRLRPSLFML